MEKNDLQARLQTITSWKHHSLILIRKGSPSKIGSNFKNRLEIIRENSINLADRIADRVAELVPRKKEIMISFELLEILTNHKKGIYRNEPATGPFVLRLLLEWNQFLSSSLILQFFRILSLNCKCKTQDGMGSPRFSNYTFGNLNTSLEPKECTRWYQAYPCHTSSKIFEFPKRFVAKTALLQCSTVENFLDRRHCDSCWAFDVVESLSDWFCNLGNISLFVNKN